MSATFTVNGSDLTISFIYTGPLQKLTDIANNAAHQLYDIAGLGDHTIPFDNLSNTAKLAILDTFISQSFVNIAKEYYVRSSVETARKTAQTTADTDLGLGG